MSRVDDNILDNDYPFKGSFKGKGQTLKTVNELSNQFKQIRDEMDVLVQNYQDVFSGATRKNPRLVNLRMIRRNVQPLVYWRQAKNSGSFFDLFGSEEGVLILNKAGPKTIATLAAFERQRLELNARLSIVSTMIKSYRNYIKKLQRLEEYAQISINLNK